MKLIGKNSISKYLSKILFIGFIIFLFHLFYFSLGYLICYLNHTQSLNIFSQTFFVTKRQYTEGLFNIFTINYPFLKIRFYSAILKSQVFIGGFIGFLYFSIFFFSSYKVLENLSIEKIFNKEINKWLKIFTINNSIFYIIFITLWFLVWKLVNIAELIIVSILLILMIISTLYFWAFTQKGYELQSENDLTI